MYDLVPILPSNNLALVKSALKIQISRRSALEFLYDGSQGHTEPKSGTKYPQQKPKRKLWLPTLEMKFLDEIVVITLSY